MINFGKYRKRGLVSEINVIPFTDIVLVILIVFMVTAPMLVQSSIKVNLPNTTLNSPSTPEKNITIDIQGDNAIYVNETKLASLDDLSKKLSELGAKDNPVIIRGDRAVNYGLVANILGIAQTLGAKKLELLVQYKKE